MRTRYRVLDLPVQGMGAFTPTAATNPGASSYGLVHVYGNPALIIPVDSPTEVWVPTPSNPGLRHFQESNVGRDTLGLSDQRADVIRKSVYVASTQSMGPAADAGVNMRMRRRNPLPMPAINALRAPRNAMGGPHVGGRAAPSWPRAFQRWPSLTGRGSG